MANSSLTNLVVLTGVDRTQVGIPNGHGRALAYGRETPQQLDDPFTDPETHFTTPSTAQFPIRGQAVQNLFTQDDAGVAYPANQWWVRFYDDANFDAAHTAGWDSDLWWFAVPDTLPAGFTAVTRRNVFPSCYMTTDATCFVIGGQASVPTYTLISGGGYGVIRTADGAYRPMSTTTNTYTGNKDMPYGPCNRQTTVGLLTWNSGIYPTPYSVKAGYHPGYRNVRVVARWPNAVYVHAGATDHITVTFDGNVVSIAKTELAFDGTYWTKTKDIAGPVAQAAAGELIDASYTIDATVGIFGTGVNFFTDVYLSPRLDIPAPFNCSTADRCIPGGIATGTVPGW